MTAALNGLGKSVDTNHSPQAKWRTLGLDEVRIEGGMWAKRQAVNRESAIPHGLRMLEEAGNLDNLRIAAGWKAGTYRGPVFMDSDVYKWLEAVSFEIARAPSDSLASAMEAVIELVGEAQRPDGYLNTHYQVAEPERRWSDFAHGHELYCAGHLFQAAVAHRRATGDNRFLGIARRFADYLVGLFGLGKRPGTPGHPEVEMALVELYRETGERPYRDLAQFFLDQRGHGWLGPGRYNSSSYYQDRVRVREATEIEGHAVRATYLAAGVADLYLETGERALLEALERQWSDFVERKVYVTGAAGSRHLGEAFGQPYELPNDLAYCETCAAIGSIMWSWRMLLATGERRYADLIERTLYNAVLCGVSLDGERYFYVNPLASNGAAEHLGRGGCRRQPWHLVACCPPNVMRLTASLGHYLVTRDEHGLQIHQYAPARIACELSRGRRVVVRMDGNYPWEGRIQVTVEEGPETPWSLRARIPGWCDGASAKVNGVQLSPEPSVDGYVSVGRVWRRGDVLDLDLPMTSRLIEPHPWIEATRGCVAIERGPLVYCLEQADQHDARLENIEIDASAPLDSHWEEQMLGGITVIRGTGAEVNTASWGRRLYRALRAGESLPRRRSAFRAIPYYAWANRAPGAMRVWIPRSPAAE